MLKTLKMEREKNFSRMFPLCQLCIRAKSALSGSHAPNLSSKQKHHRLGGGSLSPTCLRAHLNPSAGCPLPFGPSPPCLPSSTRTLQHASLCTDSASVTHCVHLLCWIVKRSSVHVLPPGVVTFTLLNPSNTLTLP